MCNSYCVLKKLKTMQYSYPILGVFENCFSLLAETMCFSLPNIIYMQKKTQHICSLISL